MRMMLGQPSAIGRPFVVGAALLALLSAVPGGHDAVAATPVRTCVAPLPDGEGDRYLRKVPNGVACRPGERQLEWGRNVPAWKDAWSSEVAYMRSEAVSFAGSSFISLSDDNLGNVPDETPSQWGILALAGEAGPIGAPGAPGSPGAPGPQGAPGSVGERGEDGSVGATGPTGNTGGDGVAGPPGAAGIPGPKGLAWRGSWTDSTEYFADDAVVFAGSSFIAIAANAGAQPDGNPAQWELLVSAGSVGETGAVGMTGATGAAGDAGPQGASGADGPMGGTGATGPIGSQGATGAAGATGATGDSGAKGLQWRSNWSDVTTYALDDVVAFAGSSFIANVPSIGTQPDLSPYE